MAKAIENRGASLQTVARAIRLLRLFEGGHRSHSLDELAKLMSLNKATTFRLVDSLVAEGIVVRTEYGRYKISYGLLALGESLLGTHSLAAKAQPVLERVRDASRETANFNVREGDFGVVVASVLSLEPVRYVLALGDRAPLGVGSATLAILAGLPKPERQRLAEKCVLRTKPNDANAAAELKKRLCKIRTRRYAATLGERESDAAGVAAPVFDQRGMVIGSISIIGPISRLGLPEAISEAADIAMCAANELSRVMDPTH